jgi:hypothetical protein
MPFSDERQTSTGVRREESDQGHIEGALPIVMIEPRVPLHLRECRTDPVV